jgi:hypothetical protein
MKNRRRERGERERKKRRGREMGRRIQKRKKKGLEAWFK